MKRGSRMLVVTAALFIAAAMPAGALTLKEVTFTTNNAGKVVFSHQKHMAQKGIGNNCKSCHNVNMKKNVRYTMKQMEQGKSCGECHNGKRAFAVSECTRCHPVKDVRIAVKETGPVVFSHAGHPAAKNDCAACHNRLFRTGGTKHVGMAAMEKGKSCGACHDGKKAFPVKQCSKCHPMREIDYPGGGAGKVVFSHKFHTDAYGCKECHPRLFKPAKGNPTVTMAEMEKGKSCGACHDSKTAFSVSDCDKCHKQ